MNNVLLIPANYWEGQNTLELEYPWLTPESAQVLVYFLKEHHTVLEFGSGGSTLFFSKRVKNVLSLETMPTWYEKVQKKLIEKSQFDPLILAKHALGLVVVVLLFQFFYRVP
jgi:hypothetical protein